MIELPRLQLGEIHEQPWCPAAIRDGATDCLNAVATLACQYDGAAPLLAAALAQCRTRRIVDLCSGGGGPWWRLGPRLAHQVDAVVLTDLFPSERAPALARRVDVIDVWPAPVDATQVPQELDGFRTLFTAFHHFAPAQAGALLQDAVDQGQGIAVFEQTRRSIWALLIMLTLPWIALLVVPFIRPWRASRLFWSYLIPAIPLVFMIDGLISCLRTYNEREMRAMIRSLDQTAPRPPYHWQVGRVPSPLSPIGVTYLIGYPVREKDEAADRVIGPRVARTK